MDVNDYYATREEQILNEDNWTEEQKRHELHLLRQECLEALEEEAARDAESDGYRRYM